MADVTSLLWLLPLAGFGQVLLARNNLAFFQRNVAGALQPGTVAVSVPARDEAPRIGACVRALLDQAAVTSLTVYDDRSADDTAAQAIAAAAGDPRFTLLHGATEPPAGWTGKNHACAQLAASARDAEWLVFVDADAVLAPGAIGEAVRRAQASGAGLLSFWPRQTLGTRGERLLVPMLDVVLLGFLPMRLAATSPDPALAAANGQCLVFSRAAYDAAGGHAAVAGDPVDDVALARAVKRAGGTVVLTDAGNLAAVRMYSGFGEAWAGFTKNLYPAFGGKPLPFVGGMGLFALLQALPAWGLLAGLLLGAPALWAPMAVQLALTLVLRAMLVRGLGHPARAVLLHPLSAGLVVALGLASWRAAAMGRLSWKGRVYALGGAR